MIKIVFYSYEGTGLGHLQRLLNCASSLIKYNSFSIHIIHSQPIKVKESKFSVHYLPPTIKLSCDTTLNRKQALEKVFSQIQPDIFVTDYLPFGKNRELNHIFERFHFKKAIILRGILDSYDNTWGEIIGPNGSYLKKYDRIFFANDPRVFDPIEYYNIPLDIVQKSEFIGYVARNSILHIPNSSRTRDFNHKQLEIVISSGSGLISNRFNSMIESWIEAYVINNNQRFNIKWILGPKYMGHIPSFKEDYIHVYSTYDELHKVHHHAEVMICHGGYNSLIEGMQGGASIIIIPNQVLEEDEQFVHARHLQNISTGINIAKSIDELSQIVENYLSLRIKQTYNLNFSGAVNFAASIFDLSKNCNSSGDSRLTACNTPSHTGY